MNGKTSVIDKILSDARLVADENLAKAEVRAQNIVNSRVEQLRSKIEKTNVTLPVLTEEVVSRRMTVANIDVKKNISNIKMSYIDKIFGDSLDAIKQNAKYLDLVIGLIERYAEDGDEVVISELDKNIITATKVDKIATKKGISLVLCKKHGDFTGGVLLSNKLCDKNLTLERIVESNRDELEKSIADILFG